MAGIIELGPDLIGMPFTVLIDKAEKSPWRFDGIRARSFIDPDQRLYQPRTESRYLGIGMGDYTMEFLEDQIAIERKSQQDFQGTLLGWPATIDSPNGSLDVHRRGRFKSELRKLQALKNKAVIVEATLGECVTTCPQWGKRTSAENGKYLYSTYLAWQQEFRVPWIFCDTAEDAAVTAFRIMEQFFDRNRTEFRRRKRERMAARVTG